jgi:hypothetical protein
VKVVKAVKLNEPIIKGVKNNPGMVSLWKKSFDALLYLHLFLQQPS